MSLGSNEVITLYNKRARHYDVSANLYYLVGFRELAYRKQAVQALALKPGDTVVEIGCGTGLNFHLLERAVGETGRIIGVDLTSNMLDQARLRVERAGWSNVELVQGDAAEYVFPKSTKAVLSSFAITLVPEYDRIIKQASQALLPAGRIVILDLKQPEHLPLWLTKIGVLLTKPFGVSLDLAARQPWNSVHRYFESVTMRQLYFGFVYLVCGVKSGQNEKTSQSRSS